MQNNTFSTLFVGQNLIKLSKVDSTNSYLKKLTSNSEPLPNGTVILADEQFAGRGQMDNVWQAEPKKNLTFSILLKTDFLSPLQQFQVNIAISVAINNALKKFSNEVKIKWPNDIYLNDRKLGGILIENSIAGNRLKHSIIGIGLNINQVDFPITIKDKCISLKQYINDNIDMNCLLNDLLMAIEDFYVKLKQQNFIGVRESYINNLYRYQNITKFEANGSIFEGMIIGVGDGGLLQIETSAHKVLEFGFKEVKFL